ncbi:uncharacterized protein Triagg1_658 [Trichoderma aggressivum f. europaeum]|uniref:Gti1/Pac2 family protein n=1 Tax=Trichoderma aggressivum f. europaeum TaxID=173218 RepID=A0AAE1ILQ5_9HYPO|nr:hypothetical protein Triagg1_658 [Trichoderma aggressivum f. europaeum]
MSSQTPLNPTFQGHVATTWDALLLFEACLLGQINHVPRRPHDRERQELISSGNIFIYEEHASGIKRWTDGISWSPSRILGNFLIYRELDKPFPPGEKKRALKRKRGSQGVNKATPRSNSTVLDPAAIARDPERSLVGSLVDSYLFKERGLVKKTISITYQGVPHHLVSYYSIEDVDNKALVTPSESEYFQNIKPRTELVMSQNFRNPVDDVPLYSQEENGFMGVNTQYFPLSHVANFSPHAHVADYGSQVMMSQALPVSAMAVAPAYSRADYDYLQQHPARDHFEAQVEAQVEAQARYAHRHHSFQYHDHLQQGQLPQDALHHQQIQQQHQMHHQQLLQRQQQQQQQQMHEMQLQQHHHQQQQQQQQFHHQLQQQPQPDEQRQNQLPSPHPQDEQQDEQQQNGEDYPWNSYNGATNEFYFHH